MKKPEEHVMSLRLPRAMIDALREIAKAERRSVAAQIRVMIEEGARRWVEERG